MVVSISHENVASNHVHCNTARLRELTIAFAGVTKLTVVRDLLSVDHGNRRSRLATSWTALDVRDEHICHREYVWCDFRRCGTTSSDPSICRCCRWYRSTWGWGGGYSQATKVQWIKHRISWWRVNGQGVRLTHNATDILKLNKFSSSPTARHLSPSRNTSWLSYLAYPFKAWIRLLETIHH